MAGLILLTALAALVALLAWLSVLLTRRVPLSSNWKALLRILIVTGVFVLILIDEIIGRYQFNELCRNEAVLVIDANAIRNKNVFVRSSQLNLTGKMIPILKIEIRYSDYLTRSELAHVTGFRAGGGWFVRLLSQSQSWPPLIFQKSTCWPDLAGKLEDIYQFSIVK